MQEEQEKEEGVLVEKSPRPQEGGSLGGVIEPLDIMVNEESAPNSQGLPEFLVINEVAPNIQGLAATELPDIVVINKPAPNI